MRKRSAPVPWARGTSIHCGNACPRRTIRDVGIANVRRGAYQTAGNVTGQPSPKMASTGPSPMRSMLNLTTIATMQAAGRANEGRNLPRPIAIGLASVGDRCGDRLLQARTDARDEFDSLNALQGLSRHPSPPCPCNGNRGQSETSSDEVQGGMCITNHVAARQHHQYPGSH